MSHSSKITNDCFVHRPIVKGIMVYTHGGDKTAIVIDMNQANDRSRLVNTMRWAIQNGVEVTVRPI